MPLALLPGSQPARHRDTRRGAPKTALPAARLGSPGWLMRLARGALQNRCFLCGNMSHLEICRGCELDALETHLDDAPRCSCCAATLAVLPAAAAASTARCAACHNAAPAFDATLAWADYAAPYDSLALALKFAARLSLAHWFARKLAQLADYADLRPELIVPVPLSRRRLAERGYNQAWEIARILARRLDAPASPHGVMRVRETAAQASLADARSRRDNLRGAFAVTQRVAGLHVAVVDDVMTSGATLHTLAHQLKLAGAARVTNLVALRTPLD